MSGTGESVAAESASSIAVANDPKLSWEADWVQRNTGKTLNAEQARCIDALSALQRPYNWPLIGSGWPRCDGSEPEPRDRELDDDGPPLLAPVIFGANYVIIRLSHASLATFDFDELTRLVLAAHKLAVRIEVSAETYRWVDTDSFVSVFDGRKWVETDEHPTGPGSCLRIAAHARQREGNGWQRHPTIGEVLERDAREAT